MRRILLLATVAVMLPAMMAAAGPASATIHSLSCADHAADNPAEEENHPGITNDGESATDHINGENATQRQPILSVSGNDTADENARDKKVAREGPSHCERT